MTMQDRLAVHRQIEEQNKWSVKRVKLIWLCMELVKNGLLEESRKLLQLLRFERITLGLSDVDWNVQTVLEKEGFALWFSRDGRKASARI